MVENEFRRLSPPMVELLYAYFLELVSAHLAGNTEIGETDMALNELKSAIEENIYSSDQQSLDDSELVHLIMNELRIGFWFMLFSSLEGELRLDQLYRKSFPDADSDYDQYLKNYYEDVCRLDSSQYLRLPIENLLKQVSSCLSLDSASKVKGYVPIRDWIAHGRYFEPVSSPDNSGGHLSLNMLRALQTLKDFSDEWGMNEVLYEPAKSQF